MKNNDIKACSCGCENYETRSDGLQVYWDCADCGDGVASLGIGAEP